MAKFEHKIQFGGWDKRDYREIRKKVKKFFIQEGLESSQNFMVNYKEKLDRVFSIYIRTLYADYKGYVKCYTCGKVVEWKEAQCGHFIRRQFTAVRFDERNCRPQCYDCNMIFDGMEESFEEHLREELGEKEVDKLIEIGKQERNYSDEEYKELIHFYTLQIREKGYNI